MKRNLLILAGMVGLLASANAQNRLVLYEEFTGENCVPCAQTNPGLIRIINANPSKIIILKYQSPIPSPGPIYRQNPGDADARIRYYGIRSAPSGRIDGQVQPHAQYPGHPGILDQNEINTRHAVAAPFNLNAEFEWNDAADSIRVSVHINTDADFSTDASQLRLHVALVEDLSFAVAPGTNGEKEFEHVVRRMYPGPAGTELKNVWEAATQSDTVVRLSGKAPEFVDKSKVFVIVWLQDDKDKKVLQAAKSEAAPLSVDIASTGTSVDNILSCDPEKVNINAEVTLKNTGTTDLTSAEIHYRTSAQGSWSVYNWSGNLEPGKTEKVQIRDIETAASGSRSFRDSVARPNNETDKNLINNVNEKEFWVHNTAPQNLPLTTNFESQLSNYWSLYDPNQNGQGWIVASANNLNIGYNSRTALVHLHGAARGESNYAIMPVPKRTEGAALALDFYLAYASRSGAPANDKLEVVYSADCGGNWTSVWSREGAELGTAAPTAQNSLFIPSRADHYYLHSLDISSVPEGALIALKATSGDNNHIFVDNLTIREGLPNSLATIIKEGGTNIYPNPATGSVSISFIPSESGITDIKIFNISGSTVYSRQVSGGTAGVRQHEQVDISGFAQGLYQVQVTSGTGQYVEKLSVIK